MAEVTANLRNRTTTSPPPPPYSSARRHAPIASEEILSDVDLDYDDEDENEISVESPITIHIDASINVLGNGNTIVIPAVTGSTPLSQAGSGQSATSSSSSSPIMVPSATAVLQSAQKQRQAKLTEMATSIIVALHGSNLLAQKRQNGRRTPIEININTGIKIEGSRNVVFAGAGVPGRMPVNKRNIQTNETDDRVGRKRRAQSEPVGVPKAKKGCSPSLRMKQT